MIQISSKFPCGVCGKKRKLKALSRAYVITFFHTQSLIFCTHKQECSDVAVDFAGYDKQQKLILRDDASPSIERIVPKERYEYVLPSWRI